MKQEALPWVRNVHRKDKAGNSTVRGCGHTTCGHTTSCHTTACFFRGILLTRGTGIQRSDQIYQKFPHFHPKNFPIFIIQNPKFCELPHSNQQKPHFSPPFSPLFHGHPTPFSDVFPLLFQQNGWGKRKKRGGKWGKEHPQVGFSPFL